MRASVSVLIILLFFLVSSCNAQRLPVYGHWCGPGHSGPADPIDELDTICMRHDKCYEKHGMHAQRCDITMLNELVALAKQEESDKAVTGTQRALLELFILVFTLKPSDPGYSEALGIIAEASEKINNIQQGKKFEKLGVVAKGKILMEIVDAMIKLNDINFPASVKLEIEKVNKIVGIMSPITKALSSKKKDEI
jgi:hypothetical protein